MKGKSYLTGVGLGLLFLTISVLTFGTSAGGSAATGQLSEPGVPAVLSYQGVLADSAGDPVSGEYTMHFALYADPVSVTSVWSETQVVSVTQGLFGVYLGDITPLGAEIFTGQELYLGVTVGTDEEMAPRLRMATLPYAFTASQLPCTVTTWYRDADEDGYGDPADSVSACEQPAGYVSDGSDCDDDNSQINPGAPELCNGIDDDCNPGTADGLDDLSGQPCDGPDADACTEGWYSCAAGALVCSDNSGDSVEVCNGLDDDCDGLYDEGALCDDGIACTVDSCSVQGCAFVPDDSACDDGNQCTVDTCGLSGCESQNLPDDTPCDGGVCIGGTCTPQP